MQKPPQCPRCNGDWISHTGFSSCNGCQGYWLYTGISGIDDWSFTACINGTSHILMWESEDNRCIFGSLEDFAHNTTVEMGWLPMDITYERLKTLLPFA